MEGVVWCVSAIRLRFYDTDNETRVGLFASRENIKESVSAWYVILLHVQRTAVFHGPRLPLQNNRFEGSGILRGLKIADGRVREGPKGGKLIAP